MKIIEPSKNVRGWWLGRRPQCGACDLIVEIEEGDPVGAVYAGIGDVLATFTCPACGGKIYERLKDPSHEQREAAQAILADNIRICDEMSADIAAREEARQAAKEGDA